MRCKVTPASRPPHSSAGLRAPAQPGPGCLGLDHRDSCTFPSQLSIPLPSSCGNRPSYLWVGPYTSPEGPSCHCVLAEQPLRKPRNEIAFRFLLFCLPQFFPNFRQIQPNPQAHPDPEEVSWLAGVTDPAGSALGSQSPDSLDCERASPRPRPGNSTLMTSLCCVPQHRGKGQTVWDSTGVRDRGDPSGKGGPHSAATDRSFRFVSVATTHSTLPRRTWPLTMRISMPTHSCPSPQMCS